MAEPYNSFVNLVSFVNMDVSGLLPLNCLSEKYFDHFDKLVTTTIVGPLAVLVLVLLFIHPKWGTRFTRAKARKDARMIFIEFMLFL